MCLSTQDMGDYRIPRQDHIVPMIDPKTLLQKHYHHICETRGESTAVIVYDRQKLLIQ